MTQSRESYTIKTVLFNLFTCLLDLYLMYTVHTNDFELNTTELCL